MSAISIRNARNLEHRRLFRHATNWIVENMIGTRFRELEITIIFTNLKETEKCSGMCEWMDDPVRPREFHIHIDNVQSLREQLRTLSHELIHIKQYLKNELYDYSRNWDKVRWKDRVLDINKIRYRDYPWEIEAYKYQTPWMKSFLKENNINLKRYK